MRPASLQSVRSHAYVIVGRRSNFNVGGRSKFNLRRRAAARTQPHHQAVKRNGCTHCHSDAAAARRGLCPDIESNGSGDGWSWVEIVHLLLVVVIWGRPSAPLVAPLRVTIIVIIVVAGCTLVYHYYDTGCFDGLRHYGTGPGSGA